MFLHFWSANLYGEWLVLTAVPAYFIVSGTGIGSVAGNTIQKHIVLGQEEKALSVFQSAWILTIGLSICILGIIIPIVLFTPVFKWINITSIGFREAKMALVVLTIYVLLTMQTELFSGVYRANGKYARSIIIINALRLMEFVGIMIVISSGAQVVAASLVYLVIRLLGILWMLVDLKRFTWLNFGFGHAKKSVIKSELIPTFSFLGFPLGHACLIQGMTTVVGIRLGPSAVVVFSVIRILTGFIKQFSSTIYYSVWPEFSTLLSTGQIQIVKTLHRNAFQITLLFALSSSVILYFFGEWIINIWTGGKILIENNFLLLMLISTIPYTLWIMSSYVSISINKHTTIALVYCWLAITSLAIAYMLTPYLGLLAIPVATLFSDSLTLFFVLNSSFKIVQDRTKDFFYYMISNIPLKHVVKFME